MKDFLLPGLYQIVCHLPGCSDLGITGSWIAGIVFLLNILIFGMSFAKGRPLFFRKRKDISRSEWAITTGVVVTILVQLILVFIVYDLSTRYCRPPVEYSVYDGRVHYGLFLGTDGNLSPAAAFGKVCGDPIIVQIISAAEKEWIYFGFLLNILLAYLCLFGALIYYGLHLFRRLRQKRRQ